MKFNNWFERKQLTETLPKQNGEQPSRREFLLRSTKAVSGALLLSSLPEEAIAWTQEIKRGDSFKEGLLKLRKEVFDNDNEVGAMFIAQKDGQSAWITAPEGNSSSVNIGDACREALKIAKGGEIQRVIRIHTHPANDPRDKRLQRFTSTLKDDFPPLSPPSFPKKNGASLDFSISMFNDFARLGVMAESKIIEARGVWTLSIDLKNGFIKKLNAIWEQVDLTQPLNPKDIEAFASVFEEHAIEYQILDNTARICVLESIDQKDTNLLVNKDLIAAYARLGASLKFEPWEDIN